jgi:thiamine biosynthesis lipoprotein
MRRAVVRLHLLLSALLLALLLALMLGGCQRPQVVQQEAYVFGTRVAVAVYGEAPQRAEAALGAVLREFDRLHRSYHAWQPSELTALNQALARGETAIVSAELAAMLVEAQRLAATGEGLFDPGLGALIELWGFHGDQFEPRLPDPRQLQALLAAQPRIADLVIDGQRVSSRNRQVQLDLGGYAKGYALDRAAALLRAQGIHNALINISGNILALGSKDGQPWRIGIQDPRPDRPPLATLPLYDGEAIGTSGDYQRYFELDGQRYAHLLDPRTGAPARGTHGLTVLITPAAAAATGTAVGTLSDAASKPAYLAGDAWRAQTRHFAIEHALRVAEDGRIEVTRALRARLQWAPGVEAVVVD